MNHMRKNVATLRYDGRLLPCAVPEYAWMMSPAARIPAAATTARTTKVMAMTERAASHAASCPRFSNASTKTGTNTAERTPPSTRSYTTLGVLFATL